MCKHEEEEEVKVASHEFRGSGIQTTFVCIKCKRERWQTSSGPIKWVCGPYIRLALRRYAENEAKLQKKMS